MILRLTYSGIEFNEDTSKNFLSEEVSWHANQCKWVIGRIAKPVEYEMWMDCAACSAYVRRWCVRAYMLCMRARRHPGQASRAWFSISIDLRLKLWMIKKKWNLSYAVKSHENILKFHLCMLFSDQISIFPNQEESIIHCKVATNPSTSVLSKFISSSSCANLLGSLSQIWNLTK